MKVEVSKEEFTKLVEALLAREKALSQIYKLGLAGLVDDIGEGSVFYEETLLDSLMKQSNSYQAFMSDIYDRKELPSVEEIVEKYWVE